MVKQLYGWVLLMVSHVPVRFDGHRHRSSADKIFLVCHVISQDRLTERQSNIMGRSGLRLVIIPPSLVAQALPQWRYNSFSLSRDLVEPIDQRVQKHYEQKTLKVSKLYYRSTYSQLPKFFQKIFLIFFLEKPALKNFLLIFWKRKRKSRKNLCISRIVTFLYPRKQNFLILQETELANQRFSKNSYLGHFLVFQKMKLY